MSLPYTSVLDRDRAIYQGLIQSVRIHRNKAEVGSKKSGPPVESINGLQYRCEHLMASSTKCQYAQIVDPLV